MPIVVEARGQALLRDPQFQPRFPAAQVIEFDLRLNQNLTRLIRLRNTSQPPKQTGRPARQRTHVRRPVLALQGFAEDSHSHPGITFRAAGELRFNRQDSIEPGNA